MRVSPMVLLSAITLASGLAQAQDRCDELVAAAGSDEVARMAQFINGGTPVDCRDPQTAETPLMRAAVSGHVDAVKLLLSLGANANIRSVQGRTALDQVRGRADQFAKIPAMAPLVARQMQVITLLEAKTTGARNTEPVQVVPADPDLLARAKLEGAQAAVSAGRYPQAMQAIVEVMQLQGLPDKRRARANYLACDVGMRMNDWKLAKTACERVLALQAADEADRIWATDQLKILRRYHPELFK